MSCACGCCQGLHATVPAAVHNRPGLASIHSRIGTHDTFLETMLARLSSAELPELAGLRTRDPKDMSVALIDAWAILADVLTFYQERIANEAYLRTATERRSLVELARLIGYVPRPGVAASVYLAFNLDKDAAPVVIPKGTKTNSVPGPGETMEAFETGEPVLARAELGAIRPRLVQSQNAETIERDGLYLKGTATRLKPGDMMLLRLPDEAALAPRRVATVDVDQDNDRTHVRFAALPGPNLKLAFTSLDYRSIDALLRARARAPASAARLTRNVETSFASRADTLPQLLTVLQPKLGDTLYQALGNAEPPVAQPIEAYAMRIEASPFGHNAPLQLKTVGSQSTAPTFDEWTIANPWGTANSAALRQGPNTLYLDNDYEMAADTLMLIEKDGGAQQIVVPKLDSIRHLSLNAYGLSGKSVELKWTNDPWLPANNPSFATVRSTRIYLGSERLELADAPIADEIAGGSIELDGLYAGLAPGRWLIVEGERTDIPDSKGDPIPGIKGAELVMLAAVEQGIRQIVLTPPPTDDDDNDGVPGGTSDGKNGNDSQQMIAAPPPPPPPAKSGPEPGDTYHTMITLAAATDAGEDGLAYRYKRDTVVIHANVAPATHGETTKETLGGGDAAKALQLFELKLAPLTYVSARTPSGIASTLEIRVNDVLWHEAPTLAVSGPEDRHYVTRTNAADKTEATFGNGRQGMRLPTGRDNVKATYRKGIGAPGNVKAGQISLLNSRPLGVKEVINPIRASGGADPEGAEAIRQNAPVALMALDRLLSVSDYADFARAFGGVGKASASRTKGRIEVVVAGVEDIPIDPTSDLFGNLKAALHRFGDPNVPISLKVRDRLSLAVKAGVRLEPDYLWESVEPKVRAAMLAAFAFDAHGLGEPLFLAEAMRAIQSVRGVLDADIDLFDTISLGQLTAEGGVALPGSLTLRQRLSLHSDQIAYLSADVPDTLILQELPS